jgi:hypothetical protein
MKPKFRYYFFILILILSYSMYGQDISTINITGDMICLFGNTLNRFENGTGGPCVINTSSAASLSLNRDDEIQNAYLYWAGSGFGDFTVKLNDQDIIAQRTFAVTQGSSGLPFLALLQI